MEKKIEKISKDEPLWKRLNPLTIAIIEKCFQKGLFEDSTKNK